MVSGLAHGNVGGVARTTFFETMFRMKYWAPHVRSSENFAAPLPWDDSNFQHFEDQSLQHASVLKSTSSTDRTSNCIIVSLSLDVVEWPRWPSTPSVEWAGYVERERWVRCWLGGQLLFFIRLLFVLKPPLWERERGQAEEWAYGGMTQETQRFLPHSDISPLDGEIHVFPTHGTFLRYLTTRIFYNATCSRNPK